MSATYVWKILRSRFCFSLLVLVSVIYLGNSEITLANPLLPTFPKGENQSENVPPPVLDAVRQDLSKRTSIPADQFKVREASQQTWSDGCLGLAQPDEMCLQALVEGWRIVMFHRDRTWVYRTDSRGRTIRLEMEIPNP